MSALRNIVVDFTYASTSKSQRVSQIALQKLYDPQSDSIVVERQANFNQLFGDIHRNVKKWLCVEIKGNDAICHGQSLRFLLPEKRTSHFSCSVGALRDVERVPIFASVAVLVHCYNKDLWNDLRCCVENAAQLSAACSIVLTVPPDQVDAYGSWTKNLCEKHTDRLLFVRVLACENRGFDIGGFFAASEFLIDQIESGKWPAPEFVFKLHSKRNQVVRSGILDALCGTLDSARSTLQRMIHDEHVGLIGTKLLAAGDMYWSRNVSHLQDLCRMARIPCNNLFQFAFATTFCVRWSILEKMYADLAPPRILIRLLNDSNTIDINWHRLYRMPPDSDDASKTDSAVREHCCATATLSSQGLDGSLLSASTPGAQERDGMIEHAFERFFGLFAQHHNYQVERASPIRLKNVHIFTFAKNEAYLMRRWIPHHAALVGIKNVHIIDHSSDDNSKDVYAFYAERGMTLQTTNVPFVQKRQKLTELMQKYRLNGDVLIPLDADEFLCAYDAQSNEMLVESDEIEKALMELPIDGRKYMMSEFLALNDKVEYVDALVEMQKFSFSSASVIADGRRVCGGKAFYPAHTFDSTDQGNHHGHVNHKHDHFFHPTRLAVVHYELRGVAHFIEKTLKGKTAYGLKKEGYDETAFGNHWQQRLAHIEDREYNDIAKHFEETYVQPQAGKGVQHKAMAAHFAALEQY